MLLIGPLLKCLDHCFTCLVIDITIYLVWCFDLMNFAKLFLRNFCLYACMIHLLWTILYAMPSALFFIDDLDWCLKMFKLDTWLWFCSYACLVHIVHPWYFFHDTCAYVLIQGKCIIVDLFSCAYRLCVFVASFTHLVPFRTF